MRCDWPAGFNEDIAHRPCELHLQLIINPDDTDDENLSDEEIPPEDEILPHAQILANEDSVPFPAFIAVDPEQMENIFINFHGDEVSHVQSLSESIMHIVSVASGNSSGSSYSYSTTHGHLSSVVPQHEEISDEAVSVLSNSVGEVPVSDAENQDELNGVELHCKETSSTLSDEDTSGDRQLSNKNNLEEEDLHQDESNGCSALEWLSSDSPSPECFDEASSNHVEQHNNCVAEPLSSELPNEIESSQKIESLSDNIPSSTLVSQLVVVPPTDFSNEISDNLLVSDSPDHLLAELLPLDAPYSVELLESGKENVQDNSKEICMCKKMVTFNKSNHTATSAADCQNPDTVFLSNLAGINSDYEVSSLSECSVLYELGFEDLGHNSNESENSILTVQNEACHEFTTDESVLSRKRKISSSSDDDMKNKVPRYLSEVSTDSVNVQEKEKYCNALSCDSENQISSDASVSDILPTSASDDNVTLTVGNVEDFAVVNRKPRSQ